ncbi:MAG: phosphate propanoyltransferase [Patescibacteria group bacterium]|jgi:putative phosphotransacetylase
MKKKSVPIEISARHVHLSAPDRDILFGKDYELKIAKKISQPGQYAAEETIRIAGPKKTFEHVRIIGPVRPATQVEISVTDGYWLGIKPQVARSGVIEQSGGGISLVGPEGEIELQSGVITAQRHLHISPMQAQAWGLKDLDVISICIPGVRGLVFHNVIVRSRAGIDELSFMLDTDEANAAGVSQGDVAEIVG